MWAQIINILIGLWIMASPALLNFGKSTAADINHIIGPLIATFAIIAISEATRAVGQWNILPAVALILIPFIVDFDSTEKINSIVSGILILPLSFVRGKVTVKTGGGWKSLRQKHPAHEKAVDSNNINK